MLVFVVSAFAATAQNKSEKQPEFIAIQHASFVMRQGGLTIFVDPTGKAEQYTPYGTPDLILITHEHGDHFDKGLINSLKAESTLLVAPTVITSALGFGHVMNNNETFVYKKVKIEAIPMYNTTPDRLKYHKKGVGNGYVLTINGKRTYIAGDTEDIPEMLALKNIDHAFVCMNLPYTMSAEQAARAVLVLRPKNVYPYHYRTQGVDPNETIATFKALVAVDAKINVVLLKWY